MCNVHENSVSLKRRSRRGVVLPVVLVLVLLLGFSALLVSTFGSDTRHFLVRHERKERCEMAAQSAIIEARRLVESVLSKPCDQWNDSFLQGLLPLLTDDVSGVYALTADATTEAFAPDVALSPVTVTCLHKNALNGYPQGLLSFSVRAGWCRPNTKPQDYLREERIRYVVHRHHVKGIRVYLVPAHVSLEVKRL